MTFIGISLSSCLIDWPLSSCYGAMLFKLGSQNILRSSSIEIDQELSRLEYIKLKNL